MAVGCHQGHVFEGCLGDEHRVERVAVGQFAADARRLIGMPRKNGQLEEPGRPQRVVMSSGPDSLPGRTLIFVSQTLASDT